MNGTFCVNILHRSLLPPRLRTDFEDFGAINYTHSLTMRTEKIVLHTERIEFSLLMYHEK